MAGPRAAVVDLDLLEELRLSEEDVGQLLRIGRQQPTRIDQLPELHSLRRAESGL